MQGLGTSDYMGSAHWRSTGDEQDPDDAYPFVRLPPHQLPQSHADLPLGHTATRTEEARKQHFLRNG